MTEKTSPVSKFHSTALHVGERMRWMALMNQSAQDVVFLVISAPSTKADRIDVE